MSYDMRAVPTLLTAGLLLAGCGADDEPVDDRQGGPLVEYQRSGGVAGVLEELRIEPDGRATVIVGPDRRRAEFALEAAELDELESRLDSAELSDPEEPPGDPVCADCFGYRIEYEGRELTWDDLDRPSESLQDLATMLGDIVAEHHPRS